MPLPIYIIFWPGGLLTIYDPLLVTAVSQPEHLFFQGCASFRLELELSFWTTRWKSNAGDARISHRPCIGFSELTFFLISSLTRPQCMWVLKWPPLDPAHSQSFVWLHIYDTEVTLLTRSKVKDPWTKMPGKVMLVYSDGYSL